MLGGMKTSVLDAFKASHEAGALATFDCDDPDIG